MKILVVDDDENSRIFLERALSSQGYEIESAPNGVIALDKAMASPPDMIIADILMPEMNGFELCHRVKTDPRLHAIPFIFYTATFVGQEDERLALSLGASRFLVKPMEPLAFFQVIREVIGEYHEQRLPVPEAPLVEEPALEEMETAAVARKLDKKVRELAAAVEQTQASEERLRLALEAGEMGVMDCNCADNTMTWSAATARIFGMRLEDFDGRLATFLDLVHPDDRQGLLQRLDEVRTDHRHFTHEFRICWHDGSVHWVSAHGAYEYDRGETPLRIRGVLMDITERKAADAAKDQFLMILSHELRTPLTLITGWTDVARTMPDQLPQALDSIQREADGLQRMFQKLIELSRMLTGKFILERRIDDLWLLVGLAVEAMRTAADAKGITLLSEIADTPLPYSLDAKRIRQAIEYLLENAVTFTPPGGSIRVRGYVDSPWAVIEVQDTGRGIPADQLSDIFKPFTQIRRKDAMGGLGIGLTLVRGIVELHGGRTEAKSAGLDQGSLFSIKLPLSRSEQQAG